MRFAKTASLLAALAPAVSGQYLWSTIVTNSTASKSYIRQPKTSEPIFDPESDAIRCNNHYPAEEILTIPAGASLAFQLEQPEVEDVTQVAFGETSIQDRGPVSVYMGIVPSGESIATWNGEGLQWVKIAEWGAHFKDGKISFASHGLSHVGVTIPPPSPSAEYFLRIEQISLETPGKPRFWVSCAQINVTDGGDAKPPMFALPYFKADDPGLTINVNEPQTSYVVPGPTSLGAVY